MRGNMLILLVINIFCAVASFTIRSGVTVTALTAAIKICLAVSWAIKNVALALMACIGDVKISTISVLRVSEGNACVR